VLQGVERYGDGVIVYSLGNFVFDGFSGAGVESAILSVTLSRAGVRSLSWTPVLLYNGRPRAAGPQAAAAIVRRIERLSAGEQN
jgi:poly-gamma-glutamate synthesis protein (capsule biosynthesis protein)